MRASHATARFALKCPTAGAFCFCRGGRARYFFCYGGRAPCYFPAAEAGRVFVCYGGRARFFLAAEARARSLTRSVTEAAQVWRAYFWLWRPGAFFTETGRVFFSGCGGQALFFSAEAGCIFLERQKPKIKWVATWKPGFRAQSHENWVSCSRTRFFGAASLS